MKALKKTENIFKWIVLGMAIVHFVTYFMPIFKSVYTYRDTPETEIFYFYTNSSSLYLSYYFASATSLLLPIIAIVFLFANFKSSRLLFFGFSTTYIINCVFTIISLSKSIKNNTNRNYEYSFQFGYYLFIITMVLLTLAIIGAFVIYLILKRKELKIESEQVQPVSQDLKINILRKRIELLDDLKTQGILTESEYEEKRADIIKELKI